jgi:PAS domain-containing protein
MGHGFRSFLGFSLLVILTISIIGGVGIWRAYSESTEVNREHKRVKETLVSINDQIFNTHEQLLRELLNTSSDTPNAVSTRLIEQTLADYKQAYEKIKTLQRIKLVQLDAMRSSELLAVFDDFWLNGALPVIRHLTQGDRHLARQALYPGASLHFINYQKGLDAFIGRLDQTSYEQFIAPSRRWLGISALAITLALLLSFTLFEMVRRKAVYRSKLMIEALDALPDAVLIKNSQGKCAFYNKPAAEFFGVGTNDLLGESEWALHANRDKIAQVINESRRQMETFKTAESYTAYDELLPNGQSKYHTITIPFQPRTGVVNLVVVLREVTQLLQERRQATQNRKHLDHVLQVSKDGLWDWDARRNETDFDMRCAQIMGITKSSGSYGDFIQTIVVEERPKVIKAITELFEQNTPLDVMFRIKTPDGEIRKVRSRGTVLERDLNGKATWVVGFLSRISTGPCELLQGA